MRVSVKARRISSAYKPNLCPSLPIIRPLIVVQVQIDSANGSITRAKMRGGQRTALSGPLVILNGSNNIPEIQTLSMGLEYNARIACQKGPVRQKM